MLTILLSILIIALVLWVVYWVVGMFIQGTPLKIIGAVLAIILLILSLQKLGLAGNLSL